MKRLNSKFYICEEGHITVGDEAKSKCEANEYHLEYIKGKKKNKWDTAIKETKKCGKKIVETKDIPEVLNLGQVWDYDVMHAFLMGHRFDASFMIGIQTEFNRIWEQINAKD